MPVPCGADVEGQWGPRVSGCGNDFDLTLLFEEVVLTLIPLVLAIVLAGYQTWLLCRRADVVASRRLSLAKSISYAVLLLLSISLLAAQVSLRSSYTRATAATSTVGVVGVLVLMALSYLAHQRLTRASTVLILYLAYAVPSDAVRIRTLSNMPHNVVITGIHSVCMSAKLLLLGLEMVPKTVRKGTCGPTKDERASIVSRSFLSWLNPLILRGYRHPYTTSTLPHIERVLYDVEGRGGNLNKGTILVHLLTQHLVMLLSAVIPRLAYTGFIMSQPFLVRRATKFMAEASGPNTNSIGAALVTAYLIVYVGAGLTQAFYRQCTARAITAIRADLIILVYKRSLELTGSLATNSAAPTLMSSDVERVTFGLRNMHECWACLIDAAISMWLLEDQLKRAIAPTGGLSAAFILVTIVIVIPAGKRQNTWLAANEIRVNATVHALKIMKGVKMTAATQAVRKLLTRLRKREVLQLRAFRKMMLLIAWSAWIPTIFGPILAFTLYNVMVYPRTGHVLDEANAYHSLSLFTIFSNAISVLIESLLNVSGAVASMIRIQTFLLDDNVRHDRRNQQTKVAVLSAARLADKAISVDEDAVPMDELEKVTDSPVFIKLEAAGAGWSTGSDLIVKNIDLHITSPSIVAVTGPIACGKSTLLLSLLGETETVSGSIEVSNHQVAYCAQMPWLTNDTIRHNILGFSDFDLDRYEAVLRATALDQDMQTMVHGDATSVGNEGGNLSGGQKKRVALARAVYSHARILVLDDPFNGLDVRTESEVLHDLLGERGLLKQQGRLIVWATSSAQQVNVAHHVVELSRDGRIASQGRPSQLHARVADDTDVATRDRSRRSTTGQTANVAAKPLLPYDLSDGSIVSPSDGQIYKYYLDIAGRWKVLVFCAFCAMFAFGLVFSQVWVVWWSKNNGRSRENHQNFYVAMFFTFGAFQLLAWTAACCFLIITISEQSGDRFHDELLTTVLRAPMSFFAATTYGKTTNRFSQDLLLIDTELPLATIGTASAVMIAIGQFGVIGYGSHWAALAIPVVLAAIYLLQRVYLRTSRRLRILEIETKAPLFSRLLESLTGLATLRALSWQQGVIRQMHLAIRDCQTPFYLLYACQNWLNLVLDLITAGLAVMIMTIGVVTKSTGNTTLGLALFSATGLSTSCKNLIQTWTQLEITMGAISRIREFVEHTAHERQSDVGSARARQGEGSVLFDKVSARYADSLPLALCDLSFDIRPGEHVAICGRTGSGKSTIIGALLRLFDLSSGTILVDNVNIAELAPDEVRRRFVTLPQEPLLLHETVRENLRLCRDVEEAHFVATLRHFNLWDIIEKQGGLDAELTDDLFSHGQKQLFCFARATLSSSNIVLLDEPSSQFDGEVEKALHEAMRKHFADRTLICITHKLQSVMEFDKIIVMDDGRIAQIGSPKALIQDVEGLFSRLLLLDKTEGRV